MATWPHGLMAGSRPGSYRNGAAVRDARGASDLEDLFLFDLELIVDEADVAVGELLDLLQPPLLVVLRHHVVLLELLDLFVGVAPQLPQRGPCGLRVLRRLLGELLAPFLREGRDRNADRLAVVGRVE